MQRFCQNNPKWKNLKLGNSTTSVGNAGCLLCSLLSVESKFHPYQHDTVEKAVKDWVFVKCGDDPEPHYIDWTHTKFKNMEFVWRQYAYLPNMIINDPLTNTADTQENILKKYSMFPDLGAVIQVMTKKGGVHWLALVGKSIWNWAAIDPWDGKMLWSSVGLLGKYPKLLGFALLKKKDLIPNT